VAGIRKRESLESYYLLYAVLADLERQLKNFGAAAEHLRRAIGLTELKSERSFLLKRLQECDVGS